MTIVDQFSELLKYMQAGIDIRRGKDDPAAQLLELRNRLQAACEQVLALREAVSALQREKAELEERLAKRADFEMQRRDFEMKELETRAVVYVKKESVKRPGEPVVRYCADCFEDGKQSPLRIHEEGFGRDTYKCRTCGSEAKVPHNRPTPRPVSLHRRSRRDSLRGLV